MSLLSVYLQLLFCLSFQSTPTGEAQFRLDRAQMTLLPAKQAILVNPDGEPVVFQVGMDQPAPAGARIRAELVGPSLGTPIVIDQPADHQVISLPKTHFTQEGIYELTHVRLELGGTVLSFSSPQSAEIQVSQEFLVTEVSVKPLSEQDLLDLGYVFHPEDYVAVNFQLALSIETKPEHVNISIPVVFPRVDNGKFKPKILRDPFSTFSISPLFIYSPDGPDPLGSPEFEGPSQQGEHSPLMGLVLIPGQLKYLKSHFAVTTVLMNATPEGYAVRAANMMAELQLPPATPAGLPLLIQESTQQVMVNLGADGQLETADDSLAVNPGEKAQAKYVVTGNVPGFHDFEVVVRGDLHLPQGKENFTTRTKASVYVRNPDYALSFEHPDAIESGEEYDLTIRVVNTGQIAIDGFSMTLDGDYLQGVRLAEGQHPVQTLGTIPIGGEGEATYRLRSQTTGKVVAGYVKINQVNEGSEGVALRVAIGDIGQRISPYTLFFAQEFYDRFPSDLTDALKRYGKKALDTSMTADHDLPADLLPTASRAVREMNRAFVRSAKGQDFGMTPEESLIHLLRDWMHPLDGYQPLDHIRRKILNLDELPLEVAFANALEARFNGSADALLTQISQENEDLESLFLYVVDASAPLHIQVNASSGSMSLQGARDLPFGGMFPLSTQKTLVWMSQPGEVPKLTLSPLDETVVTANVTALAGLNTDAPRWLFQSGTLLIDRQTKLMIDGKAGTAQIQPVHRPVAELIGTPVSVKPFELVSVAQVDLATFAGGDTLGRHHRFYFSTPVDLNSFYPLEEHITINGEPIVFGELQEDKRTLIVTSQMPLGPYHPIAYSIKEVRSQDGQMLHQDEGTYTGSSSYRGASILGRVVDPMGTDVTKAKAFLWFWDKDANPEPGQSRSNLGELLIVHDVHPDADGRFQFDYVPTIKEPLSHDPFRFKIFKVGVLLEDGRYQELVFRPQGAGQTIAAEFSFFHLGTVKGRITSNGNPLAFAKVFVTSEKNPQSAAIVETDLNGYYYVKNLQVGQVIVKAAFEDQIGLIGGFLTAYNSPLEINLEIATPTADLIGTVTESINGEVVPLEDVIVGYASEGRTFNVATFSHHGGSAKYSVIGQTDATGQFKLEDVPAGIGELWYYHYDYGVRFRPITLLDGETQIADYQYQFTEPETGRISGYVENVQGQRISNARIRLMGHVETRTDTNGYYELDFVPKNENQVVTAYHQLYGWGERGVFLEQDVLANQDIVLFGSVPLSGVYQDANGDPVPFAPIYMSYLEGYAFDGYPLYSDFKYFTQTDFAGRWEDRGPKDTIYRFTGFDPPQHAYASDITVGPAGLSDILLQKSGLTELRVRLLDANGLPVVGKVNLKTMVPSAEPKTLGQPSLVETHSDVFTDADGYVTFSNIAVGQFEVFGHLAALGTTETFQGIVTQTPEGAPQTVVLSFPPPEEPSNLFGSVYQPGGTEPAPDGTIVRLKGPGVNAYVYTTLAGTYRFENLNLGTDPVRLELIAYHPDTRHFYRQWLDLNQDLNFRHDLILKKRMTVHVSVEYADGEQAPFAEVHAEYLDLGHTPPITKTDPITELLTGDDIQAGYKKDIGQVTLEEPLLTLTEVPSGPLVLKAVSGNGLVGNTQVSLPLDRHEISVTIRLETASQISGIFVDDAEAPLTLAPVTLRKADSRIHQVLSDDQSGSEGTFLFDSLPMGKYSLEGIDPATSRQAHLEVVTSAFRPSPDVVLQLDPVADLTGIARFEGNPVPNTTIVLVGKHLQITTGTDSNGCFKFANLPLGRYNVKGYADALPTRIFEEIELTEAGVTHTQDISFGEVRDLYIDLRDHDGTPVTNVLLKIYRGRTGTQDYPVATSAYTDEHGTAVLKHLPLGRYRILTETLDGAHAVYQYLQLHEADADPVTRTIQLRGTGIISGLVKDSLGQPLDRPVQVRMEIQNAAGVYSEHTITTGEDGSYRLGNIPVGRRTEITAYHPITKGVDHRVVQLDQHGENLVQDFNFVATATVSGKVTHSDGSPAPFAVVWTESPFRNQTRANDQGIFTISPLLEGDTVVFAELKGTGQRTQQAISISSSDGVVLDPIVDLNLTLDGIAELHGVISFASGDPARIGSVVLSDLNSETSHEVRIQGDGTYRFLQLPLGHYELRAYSDLYGVASAPLPLTLATDLETVEQNHTFEDDFTLSGVVYAPNHVDPLPGAIVSLWRPRTEQVRDGYERVYEAVTDTNGAYQISHVFPRDYVLKASNHDYTANFADANFLMPNVHSDVPIYLETVIPLVGTLADASHRPFDRGDLTLFQDGESISLDLDPQGGFYVPNLRPTPYRLDYKVANGWIEGSHQVNSPSADPISLRTVDTVTLSGRAILAKEGTPRRPYTLLIIKGISRKLDIAIDGAFSINQVPVNEQVTLRLRFNGKNRDFDLGSFTADSDVGDFYLDTIEPELSYPDDGQAITTLPHTMNFLIAENETDSDIDPTRTAMWINGKVLTAGLVTDQTSITAAFDLLPSGFLIGSNEVKVRVYNTSGAFNEKTYSVDVNLSGPSLVVDVHLGGVPIASQVRHEDLPWETTGDDGRWLLHNLSVDSLRLKAKALSYGVREFVTIGQSATQYVTLNLEPMGAYMGQVLNPDGTPATNQKVYLNDTQDYETTDLAGNYHFDLLSWGDHRLWVREETVFGYLEGSEIVVAEQVLIDQDILLDGYGTVTGVVYDDDGVTPIANAAVTMRFTDLPSTYPTETTTTDTQGSYQFENVPTRPIKITAVEPIGMRRGEFIGEIAESGNTLQGDILMAEDADLVGVVLGSDGQPVAGVLVQINLSFESDIVAEGTTNELGEFELLGIPQSYYRIKAYHDAAFEYFPGQSITVDTAHVDVGTLQLVADNPPYDLGIETGNPYHPKVHRYITLKGVDDRQIASWNLQLSGAFNAEFSETLNWPRIHHHIEPNIPHNTPDGVMHYRLEVWDHLGQSTVIEGDIDLVADTFGPTVTVHEPLDQASVWEGQIVGIEFDVEDPSRIQTARVYLDGVEVGMASGYFDTEETFNFTATTPDVSVATQLPLVIEVTDREGNQTTVHQTLTVQPIVTTGAPVVTLVSPVPNQPLPLWLPHGLDMKFVAEASDPDGLGTFDVTINDLIVASGFLSGTASRLEANYVLPEALRTEASLDIVVTIRDLGGNATTQNVTVQTVSGDWFVKSELDPLNLPPWYQSPPDERNLILVGGEHLADGTHALDNLILVNDAVLTQSPSTSGDAYVAGTMLDVAGQVVIDYGSRVDVDGKGYLDLPLSLNLGAGNASHAGLGMGTSDLNQAYGSPFQPTEPGSHQGGGAIAIFADDLWLLGTISASATAETQDPGSGGSIWVRANTTQGLGHLAANGFKGNYADSDLNGGGGGRIAIQAPGDLHAEAFGGKGAGAGTIYRNMPDAAQPSGYFTSLTVANHPEATTNNQTRILTRHELIVGTDVLIETDVVDNETRQIVQFVDPAPLPPSAYLGMRIFTVGNYGSSTPVMFQTATSLQSGHLATFGTFNSGDVIAVDYRVDQITVKDMGWLAIDQGQPSDNFQLDNGRLTSLTTMLDLGDVAVIHGQLMDLQGQFQANSVTVDGTLVLGGHLQTGPLQVNATGILKTPANTLESTINLVFTDGSIAGEVKADSNGFLVGPSQAIERSHGGLGNKSHVTESYGSFYKPNTAGNSKDQFGGGIIKLQFQSLNLAGSVDVSSSNEGSGGSLILEGHALSGAGELLARGGPHNLDTSGGGRIAILVEDLSGFSGNTFAGGSAGLSSSFPAGGAGTVFYQNSSWPHGRLVVDNEGIDAPAGSTPLPGIGSKTVTTATGGARLDDVGLPPFNSLEGMYVTVDGFDPVRILDQDEMGLIPETSFPALAAGASYGGLHRLDVLEVRNGAKLKTIDPIRVLGQLIIDGGEVDGEIQLDQAQVLADGTGELTSDPGWGSLELDNYQLIVDFPLNIQNLTLKNNSSLTYRQPAQIGHVEVENGSSIISSVPGETIGFVANSVTLRNGASWTIADRQSNGEAYPLRAHVSDQLIVESGAMISTTGASKSANVNPTWGGQDWVSKAHGGFPRASEPENDFRLAGSYWDPNWVGNYYSGGIIHLKAGALVLEGEIQADGTSSGVGGSVRIDSPLISGTGTISAKPNNFLAGGGRIAIHYGQDPLFLDSLTLTTLPDQSATTPTGLVGAGTVFVKGANQVHGDLIIDQENRIYRDTQDMTERPFLTGVTGPSSISLNLDDVSADPLIIQDNSWTELPPGLTGLMVEAAVENATYRSRIVGNSHNHLELETPFPAVIPAGTELKFILVLDNLILKNGGQFHFDGDLELNGAMQMVGDHLTSVSANDLAGLPNPWSITGIDFRLVLGEPTLDDLDMVLQQSNLFLDRAITVRDVTLTDSWLQHSWAIFRHGKWNLPEAPYLDLTLRNLQADVNSGLDVSSRVDNDVRKYGYGSPQADGGETFGSLFQPTDFGFNRPGSSGKQGGGRIHLRAQSLDGGNYLAKGGGYATGGSIWIDSQVISGNIEIDASFGSNFNGAGRIAIYYGDASQATMTLTAFGEGAGGTIYTKQYDDAYGDLNIISNAEPEYEPFPTNIPAFAPITVNGDILTTYDMVSETTQTVVQGLVTETNWTGYHFVLNGDQANPMAITSSQSDPDKTTFILNGDHQTLQNGDVLQLAVVFDHFEMSSNTQLELGDLLLIHQLQHPAGTVFQDGEANLIHVPEISDGQLVLDNYHMIVQNPVQMDSIELRNGATLTVRAGATADTPVLTGTNLTVTDGKVYADHLSFTGAITVGPNGGIEAYSLTQDEFSWPPGTPLEDDGLGGFSYAGIGEIKSSNGALTFNEAYGSYTQPWTVGKRRHALKIQAGSLHVDGSISPDLERSNLEPHAGGGALWIETGILSGSGIMHVSVLSGSHYLNQDFGAGRMAIYYDDMVSWSGNLEASPIANSNAFSTQIYQNNAGAGTIYLKRSDQVYGDLKVSGPNFETIEGSTMLVGLGRRVLGSQTSVMGQTLTDPDQVFPFSLAGLYLVYDHNGSTYESKILSNTAHTITVSDPLPDLISGDEIRAKAHFDNVILERGAQLRTIDHLEVHGSLQFGALGEEPSSLWVRQLTLPSTSWTMSQQTGGFAVDESTNVTHLTIDNAEFTSDLPLTLTQLDLTNGGVLTHKAARSTGYRRYAEKPAVQIHADTIHIDATSAINVADKGYGGHTSIRVEEMWGVTSGYGRGHGGNAAIMDNGYAYGTPYAPQSYGFYSGAGRMELVTDQFHLEGKLIASDNIGGSIWVKAGTIQGDGLIEANGGLGSDFRGTGGRIALEFDTNLLTQLPQATSPIIWVAGDDIQYGAGTVYLYDRTTQEGTLILRNEDGVADSVLPTPILGIGNHTLTVSPTQPDQIHVPGAGWRYSLVGHALVDTASGNTYRVIANTEDTLTLDQPVSPAPTIGWSFSGEASIHALEVENAQANSEDPIVDRQPPTINSVVFTPLVEGSLVGGQPFTVILDVSDNLDLATVAVTWQGQTLQATTPPWSFGLTAPMPADPTSFDLIVTATDAMGLQTQEAHAVMVNASDQTAPTLAILSPVENAALGATTAFDVVVRAEDAGLVETVEVSFNGQQQNRTLTSGDQGIDQTFTFTTPFVLVDTNYQITATATDVSGNQAITMRAITVSVTNAIANMPKPVLYFTFDEADRDGDILYDLTGAHTGANDDGIPNQVGKIGEAFKFNHFDAVTFPHAQDLAVAGSGFTVTAWVNPLNQSYRNARIFEKSLNESYGDDRIILKLDEYSETAALFVKDDAGNEAMVMASTPLPLSTWSHVVGVSDGQDLKLYINGSLVSEVAWPYTVGTTTGTVFIADSPSSAYQSFKGFLDDVGFWSTALSAEQVSLLYGYGNEALTMDFRPPEEVSNLAVNTTTDGAILQWNHSANTAGDLAGYRIYRDGVLIEDNLSPTTDQWLSTGLTAATIYHWRVTAFDHLNNESNGAKIGGITEGISNVLLNFPKPAFYFTFDETNRQGDHIFDLTGQHIGFNDNGTPNHVGQIGESYYFNGYGSVTVDHSEAMDVAGGSFTVSAWVNPENQNRSHARILEKGLNEDHGDVRLIFKLDGHSEKLSLVVKDDAGNETQVTDSTPLPWNTWSHVVGISDGTHLTLYVNGSMVSQLPWNFTVGTTTGPVIIANASSSSSHGYRGLLDDVAFWSSALSPDQVFMLYEYGNLGAKVDFQVPEGVTDVVAFSTSDQVTLQWTPAPDPSGDLQGYRIYRDEVLVADNLAASTTQWIGTGLVSTTVYQWRITSLDTLGNESIGVKIGAVTKNDHERPAEVSLPVAGWTLDLADIQVDQVMDQFGHFDGSLYESLTGEPGVVGEAIRFATDNDRVIMSTGDLLDDINEGSYTLAAWYLADEIPQEGENHAILMKQGSPMGLLFTDGFRFRIDHQLNHPDPDVYLASASTFALGQYHHVVATVNKDDGEVRLFVNGVLEGVATYSPLADPQGYANYPWHLGESSTSFSNRWPARGAVDEPKIWNHALSPEEVVTLFQGENAGVAWDFTPAQDATDFQFQITDSKIDLTWVGAADPQNERVGYHLWVDDASEPILLAPDATAYTINNLAPGTLVSIRLYTIDASSNESIGHEVTLRTLDADQSLPALPQPIAHWRLDAADNDGSQMLDATGNHHGLIHGTPVHVPGIDSEGLQFTGDDDAIRIPNSTEVQNVQSGDYTLSLWFKTDSLPTNASSYYRHYGLMMKAGFTLGLYYKNNGSVGFSHHLNSGGEIPVDSGPANTDEMVMLTGVVSKANGLVSLYLNGMLQGQATFAPNATAKAFGTNKWSLGEATSSSSNRWPASGILDDAYMWDQALTQEQIAVLFQMVKSGYAPTFQKMAATPIQHKPVNVDALKSLGDTDAQGRIVIKGQRFKLSDYQSSEEIVLIDSSVVIEGDLKLSALELLGQSRIYPVTQPSAEKSRSTLRMTHYLRIGEDAAILLNGMDDCSTIEAESDDRMVNSQTDARSDDASLETKQSEGRSACGGRLLIETDDLVLDGLIGAKGIGFSSGGAVQIQAQSVTGSGAIDVRGGQDGTHVGPGGFLAISADHLDGFTGEFFLGEPPYKQGTLVITSSDQLDAVNNLHGPMEHANPLQRNLDIFGIYITDVKEGQNEIGSAWQMTSPQDLSSLAGSIWQLQGGTYTAQEIVLLNSNQYQIQFEGKVPSLSETVPFILQIKVRGNDGGLEVREP